MIMKVYLLLQDNEPLLLENIVLVGRKEDAEKMIDDGLATYYEVIEVLGGSEVEEFFNNKYIGRG